MYHDLYPQLAINEHVDSVQFGEFYFLYFFSSNTTMNILGHISLRACVGTSIEKKNLCSEISELKGILIGIDPLPN